MYAKVFANVLMDEPDFHVDLGDSFDMDMKNHESKDAKTARMVYLEERTYFGQITHSVPYYFVIGNHEQEEGWLRTGEDTVPIWSVSARKELYPMPIPDDFYTGNSKAE